jgi:hypothetical protein
VLITTRVDRAAPMRASSHCMTAVRRHACRFRHTPGVPRPRSRACLLVGDIRFGGWTLAMVAGQLRGRGSGPVHRLR